MLCFFEVLNPHCADAVYVLSKLGQREDDVVGIVFKLDMKAPLTPKLCIITAGLLETANTSDCCLTLQLCGNGRINLVEKVHQLGPQVAGQAQALEAGRNDSRLSLIRVAQGLVESLGGNRWCHTGIEGCIAEAHGSQREPSFGIRSHSGFFK